jgi:hypothetical protein
MNGGFSIFPKVFINGLMFSKHSDHIYWNWSLIFILSDTGLYLYTKSLFPIAILPGAGLFYIYMIVASILK